MFTEGLDELRQDGDKLALSEVLFGSETLLHSCNGGGEDEELEGLLVCREEKNTNSVTTSRYTPYMVIQVILLCRGTDNSKFDDM